MTDPPGALTPPEVRLIEYIAAGTPDAEIAIRLSTPIGELKLRIEALLRKLDLPDRPALAAWDPANSTQRLPDEPPPPLPIAAPEAISLVPRSSTLDPPTGPDPPSRLRTAFATAVGATVVLGGIVLIAMTAGGSPPPANPPPFDTPTAVPPAPFKASTLAAADLGDYSALVLVGCHDCGGPRVTLARISRQGEAPAALTTLYAPEAPACITSAAASTDGYEVVLAITGQGGCVPAAAKSTETATTFIKSTDGGATWAPLATIPGLLHVVLVGSEGPVVYPATAAGNSVNVGPERWAYLTPEGTLLGTTFSDGKPVGTDGLVVWRTGASIQTSLGRIPSPVLPPGAIIEQFIPIPGGRRYLLTWYVQQQGLKESFVPDGPAITTAIVERDSGRVLSSWVDTTRSYFVGVDSLPAEVAFGVAVGEGAPRTPTMLALGDRSLRSLTGPPWDTLVAPGWLYQVLNVRAGQFAEVSRTNAGATCLRMHHRPDFDAPVLGCMAPGVHLGWSGETLLSPTEAAFAGVILPDGRSAWAPLDYLHYPPGPDPLP